MEWTLLTREDYITTNWSGGTTTQLAIAPEGAQYSDRDFLWRISSAKVELEHSDFTPLPDYDRFLAVLAGDLTLKVGNEACAPLPRLTVRYFDGGVPTQSWGKCTDFNLMLGLCVGHDSMFLKYSEALVSVIAVKDRLLGHNPLAALYSGYYAFLEAPDKK